MIKIKLCGLSRICDIEAANELKPEYIGFVFAPKSRRYVSPEKAKELKRLLAPEIKAVGVFADDMPEHIADCLEQGLIDIAQLHGNEDQDYITRLRQMTDKPMIQAFRIEKEEDVDIAQNSTADMVLLDAGEGSGTTFDWDLIQNMRRPYFLAGGLSPDNVRVAASFKPYAVDVSSGIETEGVKDKTKMAAFVDAVRTEEKP